MTLLLAAAIARGSKGTPTSDTYDVWDGSKKATDVTLSNGDLDCDSNSTTGGGSVLSVGGKSAGKFYFEVEQVQQYATNAGYLTGISLGTGTYTSYPGATTSSFGLASTTTGSDIWSNGVASNNSASGVATVGQYHRIAVDVDAGKVWLAISNRSSGAWIGGGDPAAGTSPTFTFTPNTTTYPMACPRRGAASPSTNRNKLRARFDPATWGSAAPSGFDAWTTASVETAVSHTFYSATPTTTTSLDATTLAMVGPYLDVEIEFDVDWALQSSAAAFTLWEMTGGAGGTHSLRYAGGVSGDWILKVNGTDTITAPAIVTTAQPGQRATTGQRLTIRTWFDQLNNTKGFRLAVNGVYAYGTSTTASGSNVGTPTAGTLNTSNDADVNLVTFKIHNRASSKTQSFQAAILGDSTVASYNTASGVPVASLLRSAADSRNVAFKSLAIGGATIADQQSQWSSFSEKADLRWVMIQVGLNDIDPAVPTATSIAALQSLVDSVNAATSARVYIATMIPCYQRMITRYGGDAPLSLAKWEDMNDAIMGLGGSPITGVDGRINAHQLAMDDGVGNLDAAYDGGDGIHPNNAGRQVIADAWIDALEADGML